MFSSNLISFLLNVPIMVFSKFFLIENIWSEVSDICIWSNSIYTLYNVALLFSGRKLLV